LPPSTAASASSSPGRRASPRSAAASSDHASSRGAGTGLGATSAHAAPGTCRDATPPPRAPGSAATNASVQVSSSSVRPIIAAP
jgi:hypothetical protein